MPNKCPVRRREGGGQGGGRRGGGWGASDEIRSRPNLLPGLVMSQTQYRGAKMNEETRYPYMGVRPSGTSGRGQLEGAGRYRG